MVQWGGRRADWTFVAIFFALLLPASFPAWLDIPVTSPVRDLPRDFVRAADDFTNYGDTWELLALFAWLIPLVGLVIGRWYWRQGLATALLLLSTGLFAILLKVLIGRGRPRLYFDEGGTVGFSPLTFEHAWNSFPSGHSVSAATLGLCLMHFWPRAWPLWILLGVSLAATRVIVGAHWPTDALAGLLVGAVPGRFLLGRFAQHPWLSHPVPTTLGRKGRPLTGRGARLERGLLGALRRKARSSPLR